MVGSEKKRRFVCRPAPKRISGRIDAEGAVILAALVPPI
jgi:hypothetical protein